MYTLKPLQWKRVPDVVTKGYQYAAETIFGTLLVRPEYSSEENDELHFKATGRWWFEYCVAEYYDEGSEAFDTKKLARERAQAWYESRVMPALSKV